MVTCTELKPYFDNQKSFYKKAYIYARGNGYVYLRSYNTNVCAVHNGKFYRLWGGYSSTTMRHINEFRQQYGFDKINKNQWESMEVE